MSNWLKDLRVKYSFTQKELANKVGLSISTIQNIEQFKRKGSKETLEKLNTFFKNL